MARSNIGEVSIGICVTSKRHSLGVCHVGIIGDLANTKLSPAVIPEFKAVRDFRFFVQFLAKLRGERRRQLVIDIT
jgi:hypothetical protein